VTTSLTLNRKPLSVLLAIWPPPDGKNQLVYLKGCTTINRQNCAGNAASLIADQK